jgi:predicted acetyltransferase
MMRQQLDAVHARGEPVAILWASEGGIYQRFGYGLGSLHLAIDVERERSGFRRPHQPAGTLRFVDVDEATRRFPPVYEAIRTARPGFFTRSAVYWDAEFFPDPEHARGGASAAFHVVHEVAGEADGYVRYRVRDDSEMAGSKSKVVIAELIATNPSAELDLWRYLFDIDLMARIEAWNRPIDDPLLLNVSEPRRLRATLGDALWSRIVDLGPALAARRYATEGRLTLEVADDFCEWNDGTWALSVEAGVPIVEPASGPADLACDVTDLGAAYLGAFSFRQLADAGRVRELQPGAIARADALFRTERPPWCPMVF